MRFCGIKGPFEVCELHELQIYKFIKFDTDCVNILRDITKFKYLYIILIGFLD